ncbi:hypothetical protein VPNG_06114 [Cytospora leucostoma]|uniref:Uncharacterized protein n=1 Tax=Cytospora leucostoma TaxID=1230097 RepID=A0A423WX07_9PEZI|nr:hypothetical protein VPNG_06114 [Cytospora leucostoma]
MALCRAAKLLNLLVPDFKIHNSRTCLIAVLTSLKSKDKIQREPDDIASINRLNDYAARVISPCVADESEHVQDEEYEQVAQHSRAIAPLGLEVLQVLSEEFSAKFSEDTICTVLSFTDLTDPWTTQEAFDLANAVIAEQVLRYRDRAVLNEDILKGYLRPLFSKARPKTVTASGRKAAFPEEDDPHRGLTDETKDVKPWKYADHRAITVFEWVVSTATPDHMSKQWPLFIPVLLTLLDDGATRVRSRGLIILDAFLLKFPDNILRDTGLASVFEDAVFPTLHFLPTITPEEESTQLLGQAYTALLTLAGKLDVSPSAGKVASSTPRAKLLDKMLREGVFSAYFHAKEHIRIVEVLLVHTARILGVMRVEGVKHLKDLIPMYSEIMTNPFAALAPPTLSAAISCLQATIANCWPRLTTPTYQSEVIKMLVMCYLTVHDDKDKLDSEQFAAIEAALVQTASMLTIATKSCGGSEGQVLGERIAPLITKEPLLANLFT